MDNSNNQSELESLETTGSSVDSSADDQPQSATPTPEKPETPAPTPQHTHVKLRGFLRHFNIYLGLFIILVVVAVAITFVTLRQSHRSNTPTPLTSQALTPETLSQLKNSQASVGDPKQILNVESNAIFAGTVLVRQSLDVAGEIRVGGGLSLSGLTVTGTSTLDRLQASSLAITGNATIQKALTVNGSGSFGGALSAPSINVNTLQLSGDLKLNRHIDAGGSTPGRTNGSALGGGGTSSVSGNDTAGTVTINTGSNPPAGCFVTITFAQRFSSTPHVVITPIGSTAANLNYYVNRSSSSFSICSTHAASAGASFSFDYVAID